MCTKGLLSLILLETTGIFGIAICKSMCFVKRTLFITTLFVTKDFAVKSNLLL